ncbi:MAG: GTP 3',8-cyclase MoaA [Saprospiraceae bacterium]|nr:GTP 3',8-cyclase MoaA [Saprospiraceae bacterium]
MLTDRFNRVHDYLRISLTDHCNFRCTYCYPDITDEHHQPAASKMSADEIVGIAAVFINAGVKKIRLTGGEPLVRKDAKDIIQRLSVYPVELAITTNGVFVHEYADLFVKTGLKSINVSLDSLDREKFFSITGRDEFVTVLSNIELLLTKGFHIKVNVVVKKGVNESEINDFIEWTRERHVHVRFIEFMPFSGNHWNQDEVFSHQQILACISSNFSFHRIPTHKHDTAKPYYISGHTGTFSVISTMSEPFCEGCNRMRLTADGKMKNCLFSVSETDLLTPYRQGVNILPLIQECLAAKKEKLGGQLNTIDQAIEASKLKNRSMLNIGG